MAKHAPRKVKLEEVHDKECKRGHKNRATLAVARKLVAYLFAVDRETVRAQQAAAKDAAAKQVANPPAKEASNQAA